MGVKGLQFYLEKCCPEASPLINIAELARSKRLTCNEELMIVVDGSNCIREIYGDLEWIGGAQLNQYAEKAKLFVEKFRALGIRLVLFFDGPTIQKKRRTWVERRYNTVGNIYFVLDKISSGEHSKNIPKSYFHLPPGMGQLSRIIFQVVCGCEVFQSLTECDEEIADYARRHKAFAILGQDTDYVILDSGDALYLSMRHLDLDNMTTRLYDRWQLAHSLRLHPSHLPLLATFMGNDLVTADDLRSFHLEITKSRNPNQRVNFAALVPKLAKYIQSLRLHQNFMNDRQLLMNIASTTLRDYNRDVDIRNSLLSYVTRPNANGDEKNVDNMQDSWSQLVALARNMHVRHQIPSMVYAIMTGLPFESSSSVEDFRLNDLPSFAEATLRLRQRVYGILLQEKPLPHRQQCHMVEEWCMAGPGSLDQPRHVVAVLPPCRHPGLKTLWTDRDRFHHVRWQLFLQAISANLHVDRVRATVPLYLLIPTLILHFLNEGFGCLIEWEVDVMLATAVCLKHYSNVELAALPSDPLSTRGVRVANLIMRCTFVFYFLLASCGYPFKIEQSAPWLFFDGKLFQHKYLQAEVGSTHSQLCEHQVDSLEHFYQARSIVFNT